MKKIGDKKSKMGDRRCLPDGRQAGGIGATSHQPSAICHLLSVFSICYLLSAVLSGCSFDYYFNKGVNSKNLQQKIKYFSKAIEKWSAKENGNKNKSIAYLNRGAVFAETMQYGAAIGDFDEALKLDKAAAIYYNRSAVYFKQEKLSKALTDINNAIRLNQIFIEAYIARGEIYKKIGNNRKAETDFAAAKRISNSNHPYIEGLSHYNNGMYDKALEFFTKALQLNPFDAKFFNMRGLTYTQKGKLGKAMPDFNKAIKLDEKLADAYNNRGTLYAGKKKFDKALNDFRKVMELEPQDPEVYYNIGITYQMWNTHTEAIKYFTEAVKYSKKNPNDMAYYSRGYSYYILGYYKDAIKDFSMAVALNNTNSEAYSYRELAYIKNKKSENKLNKLDYVIKLTEKNKK